MELSKCCEQEVQIPGKTDGPALQSREALSEGNRCRALAVSYQIPVLLEQVPEEGLGAGVLTPSALPHIRVTMDLCLGPGIQAWASPCSSSALPSAGPGPWEALAGIW